MTFAPPRIIHCPRCKKLFMSENIGSGNTFGAHIWSDGYYSAQMFPIPPVLGWCSYCSLWFFLNDAVFMFEVPFGCDFPEEDTILMYDNLDIESYQQALKQFEGAGTTIEREVLLRTRLWWLWNHPFRGTNEKPHITADQLANLERLLDLKELRETPLKVAEIYRELGEFDKCIDILTRNDVSEEERASANQLIDEAKKRNIFPIPLWQSDGSFFSAEKPMFSEMTIIEKKVLHSPFQQNYILFPDHIEIFAFPKKNYIRETEPLISVRMDIINKEWEGWATFFYKDCDYLYRYDRLFSEEDWDIYQTLDHEMQQELSWFWSQTFANVKNDTQLRHRYYSVLYRCYHSGFHTFSQEDVELFQTVFDCYWEEILEEAKLSNQEIYEAVLQMKEELYWYTLWNSSEEWLCLIDIVDVLEFIEETIAARKRIYEYKEKVGEGLEDIELGGEPYWFQGIDQTPLASNGEPMEFVGQFWTDSLGIPGAMLVYLFYDPQERRFKQVYDYD